MLSQRVNNSFKVKPAIEQEAFSNFQMAVFKPKLFVPGDNVFDCFHFIIPKLQLPGLSVEKIFHPLPPNKIFATNPGQLLSVPEKHNFEYEKDAIRYFAIFIDKKVINDMSKEIYNRSKVTFENTNNICGLRLHNLLNEFIEECQIKQAGFNFVLDSIVLHLSIDILRNLKSDLPNQCHTRKYTSRVEINRAIDYLWENNDIAFRLSEVCKVSNLSPYYFLRLFKDTTGKTPYEYYIDIKLIKAQELMKSGKYNITEVSYIMGFSSNSHFTSVFKKRIGISPSIYIRNL